MKGVIQMNKLTAEQLILLNKKITEDHMYMPSEECMNMIKEISDLPFNKERMFLFKYRDAIDRAVALGGEIIRQKPFARENNKTALLAFMTMLELNGYQLVDTSADLEELYRMLKEQNTAKCREWISYHTEADADEHQMQK